MKTAYFDLIGGAGGDMLLAALIHAGADVDRVLEPLLRMGVGDLKLLVHKEIRHELQARRVEVVVPEGPAPHRHLSDIMMLIDAAALPERAADRAKRTFRALAEAEARVHDCSVEAVHFHEVGAVDSIADTVGVCIALELLGVDRVEASPLPVARGGIDAAHGHLPLPAPAVLYLLEAAQAPLEGRAGQGELVTPTAAALLCTLANRFGPYPGMRVEHVGYGAGTRKNERGALPNLARVVIGEATASAVTPTSVSVLEANLDDQSPELTAYLSGALLDAGALDVFLTPIQMKKGRPGTRVTVIAELARAGLLTDVLLRESSTLGVRSRQEERTVLPREIVEVDTSHGRVRVKVATRPGGRTSCAPEYEDCARLAKDANVPLSEIYDAARRAAETL